MPNKITLNDWQKRDFSQQKNRTMFFQTSLYKNFKNAFLAKNTLCSCCGSVENLQVNAKEVNLLASLNEDNYKTVCKKCALIERGTATKMRAKLAVVSKKKDFVRKAPRKQGRVSFMHVESGEVFTSIKKAIAAKKISTSTLYYHLDRASYLGDSAVWKKVSKD